MNFQSNRETLIVVLGATQGKNKTTPKLARGLHTDQGNNRKNLQADDQGGLVNI